MIRRAGGIVARCAGLLPLLLTLSLPAGAAPDAGVLPRGVLLLDGVSRGDLRVAVGDRGRIFRSDDGGASWEEVPSPATRLLTAVDALDGERLLAVGHDATVIGSRDGGRTWEMLRTDPEEEAPLLDVLYLDIDHAVAVGAYGLFLETFDGGVTWEYRDVDEEGPHLYGVALGADGALYLAGEFGSLLRSEDLGDTWTRLPSPYAGTFFDLLAAGDGSLLVCGLRGHLFRSVDGGESWQEIPTGVDAGLLRVAQGTDGSVTVTGLAGVLLRAASPHDPFLHEDRSDRLALTGVLPGPRGPLLLGEAGITEAER